jgi:hypothetical protein
VVVRRTLQNTRGKSKSGLCQDLCAIVCGRTLDLVCVIMRRDIEETVTIGAVCRDRRSRRYLSRLDVLRFVVLFRVSWFLSVVTDILTLFSGSYTPFAVADAIKAATETAQPSK